MATHPALTQTSNARSVHQSDPPTDREESETCAPLLRMFDICSQKGGTSALHLPPTKRGPRWKLGSPRRSASRGSTGRTAGQKALRRPIGGGRFSWPTRLPTGGSHNGCWRKGLRPVGGREATVRVFFVFAARACRRAYRHDRIVHLFGFARTDV